MYDAAMNRPNEEDEAGLGGSSATRKWPAVAYVFKEILIFFFNGAGKYGNTEISCTGALCLKPELIQTRMK